MTVKKMLTLALLACAFFSSACMYIVLPEGLEKLEAVEGSELKSGMQW